MPAATSPRPTTGPASSDVDLFDDRVLDDPYPVYEALRATGPAVYLERHGVWAIPRYAEARAVLHDADAYRSDGALALTELANEVVLGGTVIASDGERHARLRRILSRQLAPRAVSALSPQIRVRAERLIAEHVPPAGGVFDAATLVRAMVTSTVMALMGIPTEHHQLVLAGAGATFDVFGPNNDRYQAALPAATAMVAFLHEHVRRDNIQPGSWIGAIFDAVDAGQLTEEEAVPLSAAYTAASMDTTILGITETITQLGRHPDQWAAIRTTPSLASAAFHEALRYEAPIQGFGRIATRTTTVGGVRIESGQQVWILYGSAGRDADRWGADADQYNLHRPSPEQHLAFGHGPHLCAGIPLALLQATALLAALAARCPQLTPAGPPTQAVNNVLRGRSRAPIQTGPTEHYDGAKR
ncbi:cytochrome P450 [Streptomyces sp. NPDC020965]|uniref:cytochrome P450 n=1 Tax=Streptomyces sp. NPDC020965 TaxID=3365105 RepID=UPI00378B50FF